MAERPANEVSAETLVTTRLKVPPEADRSYRLCILGVDSLALVEFLVSIEEEHDAFFDLPDFEELTPNATLGELIQSVARIISSGRGTGE